MSKAHELARKIATDFCAIGDHNPRLEVAVLEAIFKVAQNTVVDYIKADRARREIAGRLLNEKELSDLRGYYSESKLEIIGIHYQGMCSTGKVWTIWTKNEHTEDGPSQMVIRLGSTSVRQLLACNEFLERLVGDLQKDYPDKASEFQAGVNAGIEAVAIKLETEGIRTDRGSVLTATKAVERIRALKHSTDNPRTESGAPPIIPAQPEEPATPNYGEDGVNYADQPNEVESIDYNYD